MVVENKFPSALVINKSFLENNKNNRRCTDDNPNPVPFCAVEVVASNGF